VCYRRLSVIVALSSCVAPTSPGSRWLPQGPVVLADRRRREVTGRRTHVDRKRAERV
jgi:hypothetical protein